MANWVIINKSNVLSWHRNVAIAVFPLGVMLLQISANSRPSTNLYAARIIIRDDKNAQWNEFRLDDMRMHRKRNHTAVHWIRWISFSIFRIKYAFEYLKLIPIQSHTLAGHVHIELCIDFCRLADRKCNTGRILSHRQWAMPYFP